MIDATKKIILWSVAKLGYSLVPISSPAPPTTSNLIHLSIFQDHLKEIDLRIADCKPEHSELFRTIPLEVFGKMLLDVPNDLSNIKNYFPTMSSDAAQMRWAGSSGVNLLAQSLHFVKTLAWVYTDLTGKSLSQAKILDYGCGWGRIIRLFYKLTSSKNIYALDPMENSLEELKRHKVLGNISKCDYVPIALPFDYKFDLIYAFSVFTHLSEKTTHAVLDTLHNYISKDGVLAITVRPVEFWQNYKSGVHAKKMIPEHQERGFAFVPGPESKASQVIDNDITYGDTSISVDYLKKNFPQWRIEQVEYSDIDRHQVIIFLTPN